MDLASETIEKQALQQLHDAASPELRRDIGLHTHEIGSSLVSVARALPDSAIVINRTVGLGLWETATPVMLDTVLAAYSDAAVAQYFIHLHPQSQPTALTDWLIARGVPATRGWQKFERGPGELPATRSDLQVRRVGAEHGDDLARIVCDAFDLGDLARPWLARLHGLRRRRAGRDRVGIHPRRHGVDGFRGHRPGIPATWVSGCTDRRTDRLRPRAGVHEAVHMHRGAVPGDPQHSYKNIERAGFRTTYVRDNHAPPEA